MSFAEATQLIALLNLFLELAVVHYSYTYCGLQASLWMLKQLIHKSQHHSELKQHGLTFMMLGNISSQTVWAIIQLSKPHTITKPRTLRHWACDQIFNTPLEDASRSSFQSLNPIGQHFIHACVT